MTADNHILLPKDVKLPDGIIEDRNRKAKKLLIETMGKTYTFRIKTSIIFKFSHDDNGEPILVYNEVHMIEDMRAATSCEAGWQQSNYEMHHESHVVSTNYVHLPDEEGVIVEEG